jgi:hypothetical protein
VGETARHRVDVHIDRVLTKLFAPASCYVWQIQNGSDVIAFGQSHWASCLLHRDLDTAPSKDLAKDQSRGSAPVIHGGAGPIKNNSFQILKWSRHVAIHFDQ